MTFFAFGLNYETAPLAVRERFAISADQTRQFLAALQLSPDSEVVVLSTCNRTEAYLYGTPADVQALQDALAELKGEPWPTDQTFHEVDEAAVQHVLRVASGMKSMVVGDVQILAQMKEAYRLAVDADRVGTILHRLMHTAFRTAKRVFGSTGVGSGAASVSSAAVAVARTYFGGSLRDRSVLLVGTGAVGQLALTALRTAKPSRITLVNRSREHAEALQAEFAATVADWSERHTLAAEHDVVVVATAADAPILLAAELAPSERQTLVLDLAVPRNVEAAVDALPGYRVMDMDTLESWTKSVEEARRLELPKANDIVREELAEYVTWMFHQEALQPAIQTIRDTFEAIRRQEVERYQRRFSEADREELDLLTKSILQKLLAVPIVRLKASDPESVDLVRGVKLIQSFFARPDCEGGSSATSAMASSEAPVAIPQSPAAPELPAPPIEPTPVARA
ncbi:MAG TPA: glutamyl-tRNA reductase [Rhodothermales bacterium]